MQASIVIFAALACSALAQVSLPEGYKERYPQNYPWPKIARHPRDVSWDKKVGGGKVFGTLGNDEQGLFGKAGYKGTIFNDERGKLDGQAYGTKVLGPAGDSSYFGGKLDWSNKNAKAALDVNRQIGGRTSISASGARKWNLDRNTEFSAGGFLYHAGRGRPDFGVGAAFEHKF